MVFVFLCIILVDLKGVNWYIGRQAKGINNSQFGNEDDNKEKNERRIND